MVTPASASAGIAALFLASWILAGLWTGRASGVAGWRATGPLYAAGASFVVALAAVTAWQPGMRHRLWPDAPSIGWALVALMLPGMAMCWWARLHIGRLWAGGVLVREGHRVVQSGPYAWVRHPIYAGGFAALVPFALIRARPVDLLFAGGFIAFFAAKARIEERFLSAELGSEYDDYRKRVPMLVPGGGTAPS